MLTVMTEAGKTQELLRLEEVTIRFGGLLAVDSLDMQVREGQIHALIGPNGAGKSTVFNLITGIYRPTAGRIYFRGQLLNGLGPDRIARLGIARTFQNIRLFAGLTVLENVQIGRHSRMRAGLWGALLGSRAVRREEAEAVVTARYYLQMVGLLDKENELARNLPYGEQRCLEIARALATEPSLLLLDEPAAGMNAQEKEELMILIRQIRDRGITILLVEHDMKFVMNLAEMITVLDYGRKIACGPPAEIQHNPDVIAAYLGREV